MTLLITVANSRGIHQSSDYRLSDGGRPVQTENGAKQISASGLDWAAQISFTGLARVGRGYDTRQWLRDTLVAVGTVGTLDEVVAAIVGSGNKTLEAVRAYDRRLSVVVGAVVSGGSRLFLISNWESLTAAPTAQPRPTLEASEVDLGRPRILVNGFASALPAWTRKRLGRLHTKAASPELLRDAIAWANRLAAVNGGSQISEECWVQSLMVNGRSAGKNYGPVAGIPSNILAGIIDLRQSIASEFPAAPGKQLTLLQTAGVRGGGTTAPTKIGEPRSIKFSSPMAEVRLLAPQGQEPFARITVGGLSGDLVVSKNAWSETTLANVTVELDQDTAKWPKPFHYKRVALKCVPIVDGGSPPTWDYSLDIRWDYKTLEIDIAQTSVALRSQNLPTPMPVLNATEELVMVAPSSVLSMAVSLAESQAFGAIEARFLLRKFPELLAPPVE